MLVQKTFKDKFRAGKETGCLNYTAANVSKIPDEVYNFENFKPEGGEWWTSVPLVKLLMDRNEIVCVYKRNR